VEQLRKQLLLVLEALVGLREITTVQQEAHHLSGHFVLLQEAPEDVTPKALRVAALLLTAVLVLAAT
jgi:hypothetical protein